MPAKAELFAARDSALLFALKDRHVNRAVPLLPHPELGITFRNPEIGLLAKPRYSSRELRGMTDLLTEENALVLRIRNGQRVTVDGLSESVVTIGATETEVHGDMSQKYWIRDQALAGKSLFELWRQDPIRYEQEGHIAHDVLLSTMHLMSTEAQLDRFGNMIASDDPEFKTNYLNWPQIAIEASKLDSKEPTEWRHTQDAWQMLGIVALDALETGLIQMDELKDGNKKFLASMAPFLESVDFTSVKNSGSWEEHEAVRTSVVAVETALIQKVLELSNKPEFDFLRGKTDAVAQRVRLTSMVDKGLRKLGDTIPFESPDYAPDAPEYRTADATLIYLLDYGIPQMLSERQIGIKANGNQPMLDEAIEDMILEQLDLLRDPVTNGMRRYGAEGDLIRDTYLGPNFNTDGVQANITTMKKALKEEAGDGPIDLSRKALWRQEFVPEGRPAAWVHPNAQISSWAAKRYLETGNDRYLNISMHYLNRFLAGVTGEKEFHTVLNGDGRHHIQEVKAYRIPESWTTIQTEEGEEFQVPSPHVPLNWGVGEGTRALGLTTMAAEAYEGLIGQDIFVAAIGR